MSATLRKSITDLTRRRARTLVAVSTLALAVASISIVALPTLIDRSMQAEVRTGRLADVTVWTRPVPLGDRELEAFAALPNVAAFEAGNALSTRVYVGERRAPARVLGVRDFAEQGVDVVRVTAGAPPAANEVLVDVQDEHQGVYGGGVGDVVSVIATDGSVRRLRISGEARNLGGGQDVTADKIVVLYATADTVAALSGEPGYGRLAFRLRDASPAAVAGTIESVRGLLNTVPGSTGFADLPEVRARGDWPGKSDVAMFVDFFYVITLLALLSSLVLIASTMTALVAEQTGEIGIMRAVGARKRQVALIYMRTALLLGALGTLVGLALGLVLANVLARYFGSTFFAVDVGFGVDPGVLAASAAIGVLLPPLAALPAIRRGVRVDLRSALQSTGSAVGGADAADRGLRRLGFLPRTVQIGLRGAGRRRRRSLVTAAIVALAVGNLLALRGLGASATEATQAAWRDHLEDVRLWTGGSTLFDERAARTIRSIPGVAEAEPALVNTAELAGEEAFVWGVTREPLIRYRISGGRWFSATEEQRRERVAVIEENLALATGTRVGQWVTLGTASGAARFRIVGLASNQQEDGTVLFVPLSTFRDVLGYPSGVGTYWVRTTSPDHALVDRVTTLLEDRLGALGYDVGTEITYVGERDNVAANRTITTSIAVLGFLIVAISMLGLAGAITASVLERRREIGVLRCIGARGRDVRRIFAAEGVALAVAGWLLGIPVGYALHRLLILLVREVVHVELPVSFPLANVAGALVGTVVLALLVILPSLTRAARLRPSDALRYA